MFFKELATYVEQGGIVMWPLLFGTVFLWFGLGYRAVVLRRGSRLPLRDVLKQTAVESNKGDIHGFVDAAANIGWQIRRERKGNISRHLHDALFPIHEQMAKYRAMIRTIVIVAPLLGLLGTVSGMIEMFDSLGSQTFYSQTGGIANGISQALFTTQFGLVVAIPGMIIGRLLDRHERSMRDEIMQIGEYLNSGEQAAEGGRV